MKATSKRSARSAIPGRQQLLDYGRFSFGSLVGLVLEVLLIGLVLVTATASQPAGAAPVVRLPDPTAYPSGGFPLRRDFYGGVQLSPTYEKYAVNACSKLGDGYLCRHVYGVDEVHHGTYYLTQDGVKTFDNNRRYGWQLVTFAGGRYEGCAYVGSTKKYARTWICDYRTNWHSVYRVTGKGYAYLSTFKDWGSVVASQGQCAAALGVWWTGATLGKAAAVGLVRDCGTRPYNPH